MNFLIALFAVCWLPLAWAEGETLGGVIEAQHQGGKVLFPLLSSNYSVTIQGDLASVRLEQVFENPTGVPLNASYLFPLNPEAAVHALCLRVGDELIEARIREREEAKAEFQQAKQQGRSAALLEQHRPNLFTQQLANLMPGLPIRVSLRYVQHLPRVDGEYRLVLPLVVGPRYQPAPVADEQARPAQRAGAWSLEQLPDYPPVHGLDLPKIIEQERVAIEVELDGGLPIRQLDSPTHALAIEEQGAQHRRIRLRQGRVIDNRDFVLRYGLAGEGVQAGLLTHLDGRGRFFSLLLEPPALPEPDAIQQRELVFVLDTSGSMSGAPLAASQAFMRHALRQLRPSDQFRIIDFSNSPREFHAQPLPATPDNLRRGLSHIQGLSAGGGTEIDAAIRQALATPPQEHHLRLVVFLTDGYIGNEQTVLQRIDQMRGDARLYALGVGSAVNHYLLDEMARAGHGQVRYLDPTEAVEPAAEQFAQRLQSPVLTDIQIDWGDTQVEQVTPQVLPDLFAGDSLRLLGRIVWPGTQPIRVSGRINGQRATLPLALNWAEDGATAQAEGLPLIWARGRIAEHMRELTLPVAQRPAGVSDDGLRQAVTKLGLDYALMTRWTSFIAVSQRVYNDRPDATRDATVPLPMVSGVTALAYPGRMGAQFSGSSAPEAEGGLLLALLLLLAHLLWRGRRGSAQRKAA